MNNTIEVLQRLLDNPDAYGVYGEIANAFTKAIANEKAVESAEGLPEKLPLPSFALKMSQKERNEMNNRIVERNRILDLCQIPYAKQILKVKELEAKIKEIENESSR